LRYWKKINDNIFRPTIFWRITSWSIRGHWGYRNNWGIRAWVWFNRGIRFYWFYGNTRRIRGYWHIRCYWYYRILWGNALQYICRNIRSWVTNNKRFMGGYKLMLYVPLGGRSYGSKTASWGTTRPSSNNGTSVTPGTGTTKGSWASLITATTSDSHNILININSNFGSAASRTTVVDIGWDESGGTSYTQRIPNLLAGGAAPYSSTGTAAGTGCGIWYSFPISIPLGSRIAARALGSVATAIRVGVVLDGEIRRQDMSRCGSFVEAIGITETAQVGVTVTSGTTSEGAWTSLGTTSKKCWYWQAGVQVPTSDTSWNAVCLHLDLAVGDASNKDIIIYDQLINTSAIEEMSFNSAARGTFWEVPGGSTLYARLQNSGTNDAYSVVAYGLGG
jgi:hypothetical protein